MARKQVYFSAWIPAELHARLRDIAQRERVPMAVILRDALPDALNRWEAEREIEKLRRAPRRRWVEDMSPVGNWLEPQDVPDE